MIVLFNHSSSMPKSLFYGKMGYFNPSIQYRSLYYICILSILSIISAS
jgi:hypothetical protein